MLSKGTDQFLIFLKRPATLIIFSLSSVQAKIKLFPDFVICGKPLDLDSEEDAIINDGSFFPSMYTLAAFITEPSIHVTITLFSSHITKSTLPMLFPSSTRMGLLKVAPPSEEKTIFTCAFLSGEENHATTRLLSCAAAIGPFTGHPSIFQLSGKIVFGEVH